MSFDPDLLAASIRLGTATLHEAADRTGDLPPTIQPVDHTMRTSGRAFTVRCLPGDNLWIHRAIYAAQPGDVLVVATGDQSAAWGYWGEVMAVAARAVGLAGLVLEGGSRDHDALADLGFPVFSLGACIRGTIKDLDRDHGRLAEPVIIGDVGVETGDLVVGDRDGVMVVPAARVDDVIELGRARVAKEDTIMSELRAGASTLDLLGLS